jgi:single-strand DNA-binding protein
MAGVNKVIIVGNLGRDPETKSFQNGGKIVNLRIATSETWKDKATGEKRERTEWHQVSIQNEGLCGVAERYLRKGSKVYIEGQLQTQKWQAQDGSDRYTTEIVIRPFNGQMVLLDGAQQGRGAGTDGQSGDDGAWTGGSQSKPAAGAFDSELDDDVPF